MTSSSFNSASLFSYAAVSLAVVQSLASLGSGWCSGTTVTCTFSSAVELKLPNSLSGSPLEVCPAMALATMPPGLSAALLNET